MALRLFIIDLIISVVVMMPGALWAAHPLVTDDTGTQGKGKFQIELNGQYDTDEETENGVSLKTKGSETGMALSYGLLESMDVVFGLPYSWGRAKEDGAVVYDEKGIGDASAELKWRFFEKDGFSLALKPGVSLPTGDDEKGLGTGRVGYQVFLAGSKEAAPWAFHVNVGYIGNENKADEERNLWHASLAATCEVVKNVKLAADIGMQTNTDKGADKDPAFILGGVIYSVMENVDIDLGVKYGLTAPETDWSVLAGLAFRF